MTQQNKYVLYLGLADKDTKQMTMSKEKALRLTSDIVGDCTITECIGYYTDLNGIQTPEITFKIEKLDFNNNCNIDNIIEQLGSLFNQESIALETSIVNSKLIYINHNETVLA